MAAIARRSIRCQIPAAVTIATADDLDGDGTTSMIEVGGLERVLVIQVNDGTAGTAGVDVVEISKDGGVTWAADDTLLAIAADDLTGTVVANGALNAAGVEPTLYALFKSGPHEGPTKLRIGRKTTDTGGTTWVTGAPSVLAVKIGA